MLTGYSKFASAVSETNGIYGNPKLKSDYSIDSQSIAADKGDSVNIGTVDFLGKPRKVGAAIDIGAIECQETIANAGDTSNTYVTEDRFNNEINKLIKRIEQLESKVSTL